MDDTLTSALAPQKGLQTTGPIGLILNANSHKCRSRIEQLRSIASKAPGLQYVETSHCRAIAPALEHLSGVGVLAICGGDGTVQAVLTALRNERPADQIPPLAILAGGNTNTTAGDVGWTGSPARALKRLARAWESDRKSLRLATRCLLRMEHHPGADPVYGFSFGTAAIYRGILLTRRRMHPVGLTGSIGPLLAVMAVVARALTGRVKKSPLLHPDRIDVVWDEGERQGGDYIILLATTLARLFGGLHPFWGSGAGALRCVGVTHPMRHTFRAIFHGFRGRPHALLTPANGYVSRNVDSLTLWMSCPFMVDGELFDPDPESPVKVSNGGPVTFVVEKK